MGKKIKSELLSSYFIEISSVTINFNIKAKMLLPQTAECYKCHISLVAALNTACCSAAVRCYEHEHNKYHNFHKKVQHQVISLRSPPPGFCSHLWGTWRQPGYKEVSLYAGSNSVDFTFIFKGRLSQKMWLGIISNPDAPLSFKTIIPPKKYKRKQTKRTNKMTPNAPILVSKQKLQFHRFSSCQMLLFSSF